MNGRTKRNKQKHNVTEEYSGQSDAGALRIHYANPIQGTPDSALAKPHLLQRYLWETHQYEILPEEEKRELAIRAQEDGDRQAAHRLVTSNLRLVVKIALQFQEAWMHNFLDLIQEGNLGLIQAVHKFDPLRGVKFSYYAVFWIKAFMLRFVMERWRLVKIGTTQRQRKLFFRLNKERQQLQAEGFDPKPKLLAERLGVSEQDITDMDQRLNKPEISLDASIKEGSNEARMGFVPGRVQSVDAQVARKERKAIIRKKLVGFRKICNEQELDILENRLLAELPLTLRQIGERYGISRERVRQIQNKMLTKLKNYFEREIPGFVSLRFGLT